MKILKELKQQVKDDWKEADNSYAYTLLSELVKNFRLETTKCISLQRILNLVDERKFNIDDIKNAINYFTGDSAKLFNIGFQFIDESDNTYFFKSEEIKDAMKNNELIHPEKGIPIENYKQKISIYFEGTNLLAKIIKEK